MLNRQEDIIWISCLLRSLTYICITRPRWVSHEMWMTVFLFLFLFCFLTHNHHITSRTFSWLKTSEFLDNFHWKCDFGPTDSEFIQWSFGQGLSINSDTQIQWKFLHSHRPPLWVDQKLSSWLVMSDLTNGGLNKMSGNLQMTLSNALSGMNIIVFWFKFDLCIALKLQLIIGHLWFR